MDQNAVKEIVQEHGGRKYSFPFGVHARNVETDEGHQFVTNADKENLEAILKKTEHLNQFGNAAGCDVANNDTTTQAGYVADARIVKVHGDEIDEIKRVFQDGCNMLVSTCTACDETPASNSPSDISAAIMEIYEKRYSEGYRQGTEDATPSIERKDFSITTTDKNDIQSVSYAIQSTGTAYIALHMFARENYDCARGVSRIGFEVLLNGASVFSQYPWDKIAAQEGDVKNIDCFVNAGVTAGQILELQYRGGYLCASHLGGSVIIVS